MQGNQLLDDDCVVKTPAASTRDDFLKEFSQDETHVPANEMAIAVDALKTHVATKSDQQVEKNKNDFPNNTTFQYLYFSEVCHWTTTSVLISDGELYFYSLDSADYSSAFKDQMQLIRSISPKATILATALQIQKDMNNCGYYVIDFASFMAKRPDVIKTLLKAERQTVADTGTSRVLLAEASRESKEGESANLISISRDTLLKIPGFGSLIKHNQNKSVLSNYDIFLMAPATEKLNSDNSHLYLYHNEEKGTIEYQIDNKVFELPKDKIQDFLVNEQFIQPSVDPKPCKNAQLYQAVLKITMAREQLMKTEGVTRRGGELLSTFFKNHSTEHKKDDSEISIRNCTIDAKRFKTRNRAEEHLKTKLTTDEKVNDVILNRTGVTFFRAIESRAKNLAKKEASLSEPKKDNITKTIS